MTCPGADLGGGCRGCAPPPPPAPKKNPGSAPDVASGSACDGTKRMQEETRERHLGDPLGSGRKVWV